MSEPIRPAGADTDAASMGKLAVGTIITLGLLFLCSVSPSAGEQVLLGWLYFPARILPHVTVDPPTLLLGLVCVGFAVMLMHQTLKWMCGIPGGGQPQRWTVRGTLIVTSMLLLLFVAGTAMVGATHQSVWLMTGSFDRARRVNRTAPVTGVVAALKESATRTRTASEVRMVGMGLHTVESVYGSFPPGGAIDDHGRLLHGWIVMLGPHMMYMNDEVDFSKPWNAPPNDRLFRCALREVLNPSIPEIFDNDGFGLSHVAGNVHVLPVITVPYGTSADMYELTRRRGDGEVPASLGLVSLEDIRDGTANTILLGEVVENFRPWGHPGNVREPTLGVNRSPNGFGCLPSESGALFMMCDGSLRAVDPDVDDAVMRALATPAGDEPISEGF